jgi:ATP adenylyltransferase
MDNLWAPWRIKYVVGEREPGCFLCVKSGQADDEKNLILIRERNCFAILNAFPYNPGHLMVSPYKHTGELDDLSEQELSEMMLLTRRCQQILKRALQPHGFNVGINFGRVAGAGVLDHVHIHIVPRWNGDVNFMPVIGETRVLPQALAETHAQLRQHV